MTIIGISRDTRTNDEMWLGIALCHADDPPCRYTWPLVNLGSHGVEETLAICDIPGIDTIVVDVEPCMDRSIEKGYDFLKQELGFTGHRYMFLSRNRWIAYLPRRIPAEAVLRQNTPMALVCAAILSPIQFTRNSTVIDHANTWLDSMVSIDTAEREKGAR